MMIMVVRWQAERTYSFNTFSAVYGHILKAILVGE